MSITFYNNQEPVVSLEDFRQHFAINPLNFYDLDISCLDGGYEHCTDAIFVQFGFTGNNETFISLEQIGQALEEATSLIEEELGIPLKQQTFTEEIEIPYHYRRERGPRYVPSVTKLKTYNDFIRKGRIERGIIQLDVFPDYQDQDGDGILETCVLTILNAPAAFSGDQCDLVLVEAGSVDEFDDYLKLSPFRQYNFDEVTRTITITLDTWMLKKYFIRNRRTFVRTRSDDFCDIRNFIDAFDLYFDHINACDTFSKFIWSRGYNGTCEYECEDYTEPMCYNIFDKCNGDFFPLPAKLDPVTECFVAADSICWDHLLMPDKVCLQYVAGCDLTKCYPQLKHAIIMLASAFLPATYCTPCIGNKMNEYSTDVGFQAASGRGQSATRWNYPAPLVANPWGTQVGAIRAWQLIQEMKELIDCQSFFNCCEK